MKIPISRLRVENDHDLVRLRRHARMIAETSGLSVQDQTRLVTALSEIARNAVQYAEGGSTDFVLLREGSENLLEVRVHDEGGGIENLDELLGARFADRDGELGVSGSKRLVHRFDIESSGRGSTITLGMRLPAGDRRKIQEIAEQAMEALAEAVSEDPHEELVRQNRALVESLAEKDFLIREIHHRVKNNFQLISSLVRLQASRAEGTEARGLLESLAVRIRALGLAHEQLYLFDDLSRVGLKTFIGKLCDSLQAAFITPDQEIEFHCDVRADLVLNQDEAIDIGVIINELTTNAIKHGFPDGRAGRIDVVCDVSNDELILMVQDDGVGDLDAAKSAFNSDSLGMRLLHSSVRKHNGEVEFQARDRGASVRVVFPRAHGKGRAFQSVV